MDIVRPEIRSHMMARIRSKNTKPEMQLRKGLHMLKYRFRLHNRKLPGSPDMIFPRYRAAIFVHGCFWHGHDCELFRMPSTRRSFWKKKIHGNKERDERVLKELTVLGWRHAVIWECSLRGRGRLPGDLVLAKCSDWLSSTKKILVLRGRPIRKERKRK